MLSILRHIVQHGRYYLSRFARDERGVTTIEYGILAAGLALIIAALVAENGAFNNALNSIFEHIIEQLPQSDAGSGSGNAQ
ncbi:MAG: Flp family type IVb pilin [Deltaproteobacteria bacterium]|jgi:pilus assembly protein Flp/PilA|nr:Flp family type IVb pilin [Deltaproteobacteria bacterium]